MAMRLTFGEHISGLDVDGTELHAPVFDENAVRAAAGITMVVGAVAFAYAYFDAYYVPLQVVTTFFFVEFAVRLLAGLRYSPVGIVSRLMTRGYPPNWVSAKPKRFAWMIGLGMSFAMMVITNSGVRGYLPRTICLLCLALMWLESVLGLCLGCKLHAVLVRQGVTTKDPDFEICAHGVCEIPGAATGETAGFARADV